MSARRLVSGASASPSMSTSWLKLRSSDTRFGHASRSPDASAVRSALCRSATVAEDRSRHPVASWSSARVIRPCASTILSSAPWTTSTVVALSRPSDDAFGFVPPERRDRERVAPKRVAPGSAPGSRFDCALSLALALSYAPSMPAVGTTGTTGEYLSGLGGKTAPASFLLTSCPSREFALFVLAKRTAGARRAEKGRAGVLDRRCFAPCAPWVACARA